MPTCPNCGSYVPLGNHSCSCGTTIRHDDSYKEDTRTYSNTRTDNPYDYDILNELYHNNYLNITCLDEMNRKISEVEDKFSARYRDYSITGKFFIFSFSVEVKYYNAIIRAAFDNSYAYNDFESIEDIVTPDLSKLYSSEEFKELVKNKEKELDAKFISCTLRILGDELTISVNFEWLNVFFMNGYDMKFL